MTADEHAELQRIFAQACRLAPAERVAILEQARAGALDLRAEVDALLVADAEAAVAFDATAGGAELLAGALVESGEVALLDGVAPAWLPDVIGSYRILRQIGGRNPFKLILNWRLCSRGLTMSSESPGWLLSLPSTPSRATRAHGCPAGRALLEAPSGERSRSGRGAHVWFSSPRR